MMIGHDAMSPASGAAPRVLVVDGSRVARELIERVLRHELRDCVVLGCAGGIDAIAALDAGAVDLVTTALVLPDMDGVELARRVRADAARASLPIIVVSSDVEQRLIARTLSDDVTDYFDKALGYPALAAFVRGYVRPNARLAGRVLYVEDSRVVALATIRMLEKAGLTVTHVSTVEAAFDALRGDREQDADERFDIVLTDINLKGGLRGGDLVERIRGEFGHDKRALPVLVMTGEQKAGDQAALLRAGANDLVAKPVDERVLINKIAFRLDLSRCARDRSDAA